MAKPQKETKKIQARTKQNQQTIEKNSYKYI